MKVFTFNPQTGQRGEQLADVRVFGSTNREMVKCVTPTNADSDWRVATKLFDKDNNEIKFDQPVCLCLGQFTAGESTSWQWLAYIPQ
jgi:hypothetical protein